MGGGEVCSGYGRAHSRITNQVTAGEKPEQLQASIAYIFAVATSQFIGDGDGTGFCRR